jgi:hypothetical protein
MQRCFAMCCSIGFNIIVLLSFVIYLLIYSNNADTNDIRLGRYSLPDYMV